MDVVDVSSHFLTHIPEEMRIYFSIYNLSCEMHIYFSIYKLSCDHPHPVNIPVPTFRTTIHFQIMKTLKTLNKVTFNIYN